MYSVTAIYKSGKCDINRDVMKFEFEFENFWTSNVFSRFEIRSM